jgi:hypothetical protein
VEAARIAFRIMAWTFYGKWLFEKSKFLDGKILAYRLFLVETNSVAWTGGD